VQALHRIKLLKLNFIFIFAHLIVMSKYQDHLFLPDISVFPSFTITLFLVFIINTTWAQKTANPEKAQLLKKLSHNKNAKVTALRISTQYNFELKGDNISVTENETSDFISLQGNVDYVRHAFYNDNMALVDNDLRYTNGKSIKKETVCGNYEVDDVFYSDSKVCSYKFNLLNEGTEVTFKTKSVYNDPKYLTKVFFHDELPVEERVITFSIPSSITVELAENNFTGYDIKKSVAKEGSKTVYSFTVKNLKAMKSEPNSLGALYQYPHLIVLTKDYATASGKKNIMASVDDLYKWCFTLTKEVKNDQSVFKDFVTKLTQTAKTPEDKIKAIYYWVQDNIKYVAFEDGIAGFKPDAAQNVYNNRFGDCKGMANLTKEMLKVAGFDARLTWIGTNRIPYNHDLPTLAVDNHMICSVYLGDKHLILDPTEKYIALGKHAERIQGKEMLIENGAGYLRKQVPVSTFNDNLIARNETVALEGEMLTGSGECSFNGESRKNILYFSNNIKQENQKKIYEHLAVDVRNNKDLVEILNEPSIDREKSLDIKYKYALNNKISRFEKDTYIDLDWNKTYSDLKIEDERESDYYFNRKVWLKTTKKFKLPAGYKVTHLPKSFSKKHNDFSFNVDYKQTGADVIYNMEIVVKNGLVKKTDFAIWNGFISELNEFYSDQLIITKIN
jgi:transglutaminase-like putative cysteine protease